MLINSIYFGFTLRKKSVCWELKDTGIKQYQLASRFFFIILLVLLFYYKSCMKLINLHEGSFDCSMGGKVQNV